MKQEVAAITAKVGTTAAAAVGFASMTPWAWVAAVLGAAASFYFEPSRRPRAIPELAFGIFSMAFLAACCALGLPHVAIFGVAEIAQAIPLDVRTGACGIVAGAAYRILRGIIAARTGVDPT